MFVFFGSIHFGKIIRNHERKLSFFIIDIVIDSTQSK